MLKELVHGPRLTPANPSRMKSIPVSHGGRGAVFFCRCENDSAAVCRGQPY